mgnify:CR=1 FL=1
MHKQHNAIQQLKQTCQSWTPSAGDLNNFLGGAKQGSITCIKDKLRDESERVLSTMNKEADRSFSHSTLDTHRNVSVAEMLIKNIQLQ